MQSSSAPTAPTAGGPPSNAPFDEVLAAMAEVDRLKSREELLAAEADLPQRVAAIADRLKEVYRKQGLTVSEEVIARGVQQFFTRRLTFRAPESTWQQRVAIVWIERRRILVWAGGTAAAGVLAFAAVYFGIVRPIRLAEERQVALARAELVATGTDLRGIGRTAEAAFSHARVAIDEVQKSAGVVEMQRAGAVAIARLNELAERCDRTMKSAEQALQPFASPTALTSAETSAAHAAASSTRRLEAEARRLVDQATAVPHELAKLESARAALEAAWARVESQGPAPELRAQAVQLRAAAHARVAGFEAPATVADAASKLNALADASVRLQTLPAQLRAAATQARDASRDRVADERIVALERAGLAAAAAADEAGARRALAELEDVLRQLRISYRLRIVNRPGEYTRLWRVPKRNSAARNYYVVVEAIGDDDRPVALPVRSEEDNRTSTVSKWAERVDQATYEQVGADKKDDGIVQNDIFAEKEKGFLRPAYRLGAKASGGVDLEGGRIVRWEYKG
jgi:hypothetical protein